jgi:choline dehydrogenase
MTTSNSDPHLSQENNLRTGDTEFAERVRLNQQKLTAALKPHYDFIVCGSGSSGSVVARRLAENLDVSVLLIEAGGSDDVPNVTQADQWFLNLGSERDWNFRAQPNPLLNGRSIPLSMGKVLGGGSGITLRTEGEEHENRKSWRPRVDENALRPNLRTFE